ncbi:PTS sugar transporter subunit IIB [Candidatus Epulonipiscioides gigas]|nr:PTS sugar transporter subunit IIB [Epulopiscium sp. SCG-C07WGA-EpuloA2]
MIKVAVFCAAGMSTSLLVKKIKEAAIKKDIEIEINAYSETEMSRHTDVDCVLLGPQIQYALKNAQKIFDPLNIKVEVINTVDYGMMNGEKVLSTIEHLIK